MTVTTGVNTRSLRLREIAENLGLGGQGQIAGSRSTSERGESFFRDAISTSACDYRRTDVESTKKFDLCKQIANSTDSHLFCAEGGEG